MRKRQLFHLLSFALLVTASWFVWLWVIPAQPRASLTPFSDSHFVAFTPDSKMLITREPQWRMPRGAMSLHDMVSCPSRIQIWDAQNGTLLRTFGALAEMNSVIPMADSRRLVAWQAGKPDQAPNAMQICDIRSGEVLQRLTRPTKYGSGMVLEFSPDDKWLSITPKWGYVGHFYLWRKESDSIVHFDDKIGPRLTFSADGKLVAGSGQGAQFAVEVWRLGDFTRPWRKYTWLADEGCVFPECRTAATYYRKDRDIAEARLWDLDTGRLLATFPVSGRINHIRYLDFPPEGKILTNYVDPTASVAVWDVSGQPKLIAVLSEWEIAVSPDDNWILQSEQKGVHLTGLRSGKSFSLTHESDHPLSNHDAPGQFSPDSRFVAVTGIGRLIEPHPIVRFLGKFLPIKSTEELRPIARLWEVETGAELAAIDGCCTKVLFSPDSVLFSPDSKTAAALHEDGRIRLWDIPPRTKIWQILGSAVTLWLLVFVSSQLWQNLRRRPASKAPSV